MQRTLCLFSSLLFLFFISACNSSGGGSTGNNNKEITGSTEITGYLTDGPIEGALVVLYDSDGNKADICTSGICETRTSNGDFIFEFSSATERSALFSKGYYIKSSGGADTELGNIPALPMEAPLDLYDDETLQFNITPLTTLISKYMEHSSETDVEAAKTKIAEITGLSASDLTAAYTSGSTGDKISKALTYLANLNNNGFNSSDFANPLFDENGGLITSAGSAFDLIVPDADKTEAEADLNTILSSQYPSESFKLLVSANLIFDSLKGMFDNENVDSNFTDNAETYKVNSSFIAEKLLETEDFSVDNSSAYKSVKYILKTYGLYVEGEGGEDTVNIIGSRALTDADLTRTVSDTEISIVEDENLAVILQDSIQYYVEDSLMESEFPGNDNAKRAEYYFSSNLSHLYKAESIIGYVLDDEVNDHIYGRIVAGYAENGLFEKAENIIKNQMYRTDNIGDAWVKVGEEYLKAGNEEKGIEALSNAEAYYKLLISSKGEGNADAEDAYNIQILSGKYREFELTDKLDAILVYFNDILTAIEETDSTTIGRMVVALHKSSNSYYEAGDPESALSAAKMAYTLAKSTPANDGESYYKARTFNIAYILEDFASLDKKEKVLEAYNAFVETRNLSQKTYDNTWVYVRYAAQGLSMVGLDNELENLINEAFAEGSGCKDTYKNRLKTFSIKVAGLENLDEAYTLLEEYYEDIVDQIEALTYDGVNKNMPNLALALINDEQYTKALSVISKAEGLLDTLYPDLTDIEDVDLYTDKIIRGYNKLAILAIDAGDTGYGISLLEKSSDLLDSFKGYQYKTYAIIEIALQYNYAGATEKAKTNIEYALSYLNAVGDLDTTDSETAEINADSYEKIIDAWIELSERQSAVSAITNYITQSKKIVDEDYYNGQAQEDDIINDFELEARNLIDGALYYIYAGEYDLAYETLEAAQYTISKVNEQEVEYDIYVGVSGTTFEGLIMAYIEADGFDKALNLTDSLTLYDKKKEALEDIADAFGSLDRFPEVNQETYEEDHPAWRIATVDTDGDGKPDFFSPLATDEEIAASGLELDDDSDDDGILDTEDARPFYQDN